jgi:transcriptional repressor NrdR
MTCSECGGNSRVVDVRKYVDGSVNKRRRECLECKRRFTTYEEEYKKKK